MIQLLLVIIYLSFISLGLPDSLLGSAWPSMYNTLNVPVSYAGIISMIIAMGTIISSLQSDRFTRKLGTGKITLLSVGMTAIALLGFSTSHSFWLLCLWAIPFGLGAGSVDAALNNYVALHYKSRHMSWLHCMWGVGASLGPYVMGYALLDGQNWNMGYLYISMLQIGLTFILLVSQPLWKHKAIMVSKINTHVSEKSLTLKQVISLPGAKEIMITFFGYCALEQTVGLWGTSYLVLHNGLTPESAAQFAALFFLGITLGRAVSGFLTLVVNNVNMVRLGQLFIFVGLLILILPFANDFTKVGFVLIGLGCAPIYPSIIHSTPEIFGTENSQAVIGIEMASAYVGTCIMPPLFGVLAQNISINIFPAYIFLILIVMIFMHEKSILKSKQQPKLRGFMEDKYD